MRVGAVGYICQQGHRSVSRLSRWSSISFFFKRDGASGKARSYDGSFVTSLLLTAVTIAREPTDLCKKIVQKVRKVNSLNDAKEFYDFETARSSGLSHVLSHRVSNPSPRGLISRTFCLQLASRNSFGTSGHVVDDLFAPGEPSAAIFGNSRNVASASCGLVFFFFF